MIRFASKFVKLILDIIQHGSLGFGIILYMSMSILALLSVILRYIFESPWGWETEILGYLMAWGVLMGLATVTRENSHIRISFFAEKIWGPKRAERIWVILEDIIGIGACAFFTYHAARWIKYSYESGAKNYEFFHYSYWIPRSGIAIGLGLMTLFYVERLVRDIKSTRISRESEKADNTTVTDGTGD